MADFLFDILDWSNKRYTDFILIDLKNNKVENCL
jgi:hypothetical protein